MTPELQAAIDRVGRDMQDSTIYAGDDRGMDDINIVLAAAKRSGERDEFLDLLRKVKSQLDSPARRRNDGSTIFSIDLRMDIKKALTPKPQGGENPTKDMKGME